MEHNTDIYVHFSYDGIEFCCDDDEVKTNTDQWYNHVLIDFSNVLDWLSLKLDLNIIFLVFVRCEIPPPHLFRLDARIWKGQ